MKLTNFIVILCIGCATPLAAEHAWPKVLKEFYGAHLQSEDLREVIDSWDSSLGHSSSEEWHKISKWRRMSLLGLRLGPWTSRNRDPRAFASIKSMESPKQDFVDYVYAYINGHEIEHSSALPCRTPFKYNFVKQLFPDFDSPLDEQYLKCRPFSVGLMDDVIFIDPIWRHPISMGPLTPDKVLGFEILYATPGVKDAAEVAGHLLLRIKIDNNMHLTGTDLANPHDLVIGFLANTEAKPNNTPLPRNVLDAYKCQASENEDNSFDPLAATTQAVKGLFGGYLTTMERSTLFSIIKRYSLDEDRTLIRYKLNVTEEQKVTLLERLYLAKKNYREKYFFFDRNCASVLFTVLGEGLNDPDIMEFDNIVMPPNALLSLLHQKGWIEPIDPPIYSHKLQAAMAQKQLREIYLAMNRGKININWPDAFDLTHQDESIRAKSFFQLLLIAKAFPEYEDSISKIVDLAPYSELWHLDKKQACENYTSAVVNDLRKAQNRGLRTTNSNFKFASLSTGEMLRPQLKEKPDGSPNSGLNQLVLGTRRKNHMTSALIGMEIFGQKMSPYTAHPLQRGTELTLGSVQALINPDAEQNAMIDWNVDGLKIRKFKELVDDIPSVFGPRRDWGFGVSLLDYETEISKRRSTFDVAGVELLGNFVSNRSHQNFLFGGVGVHGGKYINFDAESGNGVSPELFLRAQLMAPGKRNFRVNLSAKMRRTYLERVAFETHSFTSSIEKSIFHSPEVFLAYSYRIDRHSFSSEQESQHLIYLKVRSF